MAEKLPDTFVGFVKRFRIAIVVCIAPCLIAIGIYVWNFRSSSLSPSAAEWGQFSDFLNSSIAVCLGIGNLLLLYLLTRVANKLHGDSLERQLKFELYKDFIIKLDDYSVRCLSDRQNESSDIFLAFIYHHAKSAIENFEGLVDVEIKEDDKTFSDLCEQLATDADAFIGRKIEPQYLNAFVASVTKMKTMIFRQIKLDR
jgi:hypothetical protein